MTEWDFDEDLGGTFALDKIASNVAPTTPVDEADEVEPAAT